jgi:hypothetical protein
MAWRANSGDGNWSARTARRRLSSFQTPTAGVIDTANYRFRVLKPLAENWESKN